MLTLKYEIAEIQELKLTQPLSVYLLELLDKCMKMNIDEVPTVDEILYELPFYKHSLPVRYPDNDVPSTYWVEKDNKK